MPLLLSNRIRKQEFGATLSPSDRDIIIRYARADLATPIAGAGLPADTRLLKAYATSKGGARRIVYLLSVKEGDLFLLFFRDKNDKVGKNVTIKNPDFKKQLLKHLDLLASDIESGNYEILS